MNRAASALIAAALLASPVYLVEAQTVPATTAADTAPVPRARGAYSKPQPVVVTASASGISATLSAPVDQSEVGVAIPFTLTVVAAEGVTLTMPTIGPALGGFEVRGVEHRTLGNDEVRTESIRFLATTFESGLVETAPIEIVWKDGSGVEQRLTVDATAIEVSSLVGAEFDPAIYRDIKSAVDIDLGQPVWLWLTLGSVAVLAAVLIALRARRRTLAARRLAPHEWAIAELDRLERDGLVATGALHAYWVRLSDIVRHYIERRFEIAAPEQTTKEFLASVSDHPMIGAEHRHLLTDFLRAADMVKFAAHQPAQSECARGLEAARGFVLETTPSTSDPAPRPIHAEVLS
ncbi:MAG: hypothetical protein EXS03_01190 [Phycisphaerales bacterium]|nr:hypothetical protein [Phycisphaerales bacterium]